MIPRYPLTTAKAKNVPIARIHGNGRNAPSTNSEPSTNSHVTTEYCTAGTDSPPTLGNGETLRP